MRTSKRYVVNGYLTISVYKVIEAKNKAEARRKAECLAAPSLCNQCSSAGEGADEEWELNEWDDPPEDAIKHIEKEKGRRIGSLRTGVPGEVPEGEPCLRASRCAQRSNAAARRSSSRGT